MRIAFSAILVLLALHMEGQCAESEFLLRAGEYLLHVTASEGPRRGNSVNGSVILRESQPGDQSPSGQKAKDRDIAAHPLYGWTDVRFEDVGAPMSSDGPEPKANSTDPICPGILVDVHWKPRDPSGRPPDAPILWVGTVANLRDGSTRLDGSGVILFVMKRKGNCLTGSWQEAGIIRMGRGLFSLCSK